MAKKLRLSHGHITVIAAIALFLAIWAFTFLLRPYQDKNTESIVQSLREQGLLKRQEPRYEGLYSTTDSVGQTVTLRVEAYQDNPDKSVEKQIKDKIAEQAEERNIALPGGFESDIVIIQG